MITAAPTETFRDYLQTWAGQTVLDTVPGERISRTEIRRRILTRAFRDSSFRRDLVENTRMLFAIIFDECLGIDRYKFIDTIRSYPVLYERPDRLYLEVPTCHRGCTLPEAIPSRVPESTECKLCERTFPLAPGAVFVQPKIGPAEVLTRREIERHIQKRLAWDPRFAEALFANPSETYVRYAKDLSSGRLPAYLEGVSTIELVHESNTEMFFIFPTPESFALELDS